MAPIKLTSDRIKIKLLSLPSTVRQAISPITLRQVAGSKFYGSRTRTYYGPRKVGDEFSIYRHDWVGNGSMLLIEDPDGIITQPEPVNQIPEPVNQIPEPVNQIPEPVNQIPEPVNQIPDQVDNLGQVSTISEPFTPSTFPSPDQLY